MRAHFPGSDVFHSEEAADSLPEFRLPKATNGVRESFEESEPRTLQGWWRKEDPPGHHREHDRGCSSKNLVIRGRAESQECQKATQVEAANDGYEQREKYPDP